MKTLHFHQVYVHSAACSGGPMEKDGLLKGDLDVTFDEIYCGEKTYEMAERRLVATAVEAMLKKGNLKAEEIDCYIGSDLINQLGTAHYFMKHIEQSFMGVYGYEKRAEYSRVLSVLKYLITYAYVTSAKCCIPDVMTAESTAPAYSFS